MLSQFLSIGVIVLLGAMLPGPDFAIVTRNTILHSRRSGLFTSFGIGSANLIHMIYCVLGLALVISQSLFFFNLIKYAGAFYLMYLGVTALLSKQPTHFCIPKAGHKKATLSDASAFRQGFLCNLLNPKATLFFLALFTVIIKPETPRLWASFFALEILCISVFWFCSLTVILSHRPIKALLEKAEKYIAKLLGLFLISLSLALAFLAK